LVAAAPSSTPLDHDADDPEDDRAEDEEERRGVERSARSAIATLRETLSSDDWWSKRRCDDDADGA
jgi:hypothetical protein